MPIEWEQFDLSGYTKKDEPLLKEAMDSIRRNRVALKGRFSHICAASSVDVQRVG